MKASFLLLLELMVIFLCFSFFPDEVSASGAIYIRADGSIDPPTAPIQRNGNLYNFASDIYDSIIIETDNIMIDGNAHILRCLEAYEESRGIVVSGRSSVRMRNLRIVGFSYGIWFSSCSNVSVSKMDITSDMHCIYLGSSSNNGVMENNITSSSGFGVYLDSYSENNLVFRNNVTSSNSYAVYIEWYSNYNNVTENSITAGGIYCIYNGYCNHNSIIGNTCNGSGWYTVFIDCSSYNIIRGNNITAQNGHGVYLDYSSCHNNITENNIVAREGCGVNLDSNSNHNSVNGNNIAQSQYGIFLFECSDNLIYHNNFLNNTLQAYLFPSAVHTWDMGYPLGGNYWSHLKSSDFYGGTSQNETGLDGIADSPYMIDPTNVDSYPLIKPYDGNCDVGFVNSSLKTTVGKAYTTNMSMKILNYGVQTATVNFTLKIDSVIVWERMLNLTSRRSMNLSFLWNTTDMELGNHTVIANVACVSEEMDISDNTLGSVVLITKKGDITGDGKVNVLDLIIIANSLSPDRYYPNADIKEDGIINVLDLILTAKYLGT